MLNSCHEINVQAHFYLRDLISFSGQPATVSASLCRGGRAPLSLIGKPAAAFNQCYRAARVLLTQMSGWNKGGWHQMTDSKVGNYKAEVRINRYLLVNMKAGK